MYEHTLELFYVLDLPQVIGSNGLLLDCATHSVKVHMINYPEFAPRPTNQVLTSGRSLPNSRCAM